MNVDLTTKQIIVCNVTLTEAEARSVIRSLVHMDPYSYHRACGRSECVICNIAKTLQKALDA